MDKLQRRRALLELIHSYEMSHTRACESLGYDPYRTDVTLKPRGESRRLEIQLWESGIHDASCAYHLREVLELLDKEEK